MIFKKGSFFLFSGKVTILALVTVLILIFMIVPCLGYSNQSINQNNSNIKNSTAESGGISGEGASGGGENSTNTVADVPNNRGGAGAEAGAKDKHSEAAENKGEGVPAYEFKAPTFEETKISYPVLILKTVAVLAVIVISIFVLFKILVKGKGKIISDSDVIRVLATYPLSANKVIQIVDIGGKVLVLGVTESNINLITTIEDKEVIDAIKLQYSKEKAQKTGFKDQFTKLLGGKIFNKMGQISYLDNYRKRIKKMKKF